MAIRLVRAAAFSVLTVALILAAATAFLFWRLASGPVDLGFLNARIESMVNNQLQGGTVDIQRTVLETDTGSWIPTIRFVNVTFRDGDGNSIAQLPKAGITLDRSRLLTGSISPRTIVVTGAKLNVTRRFDGAVDLGIAEASDTGEVQDADAGQAAVGQSSTTGNGKGNGDGTSAANEFRLVSMLQDLMDDPRLLYLDAIRVSKAQISLYDEVNDARWYAPRAELELRRKNKLLELDLTASVATSGTPWQARVTASFERGNPSVRFVADFSDFIPAEAAAKIFALSQLARVQNPISGIAHFEVGESGALLSADAEYTLGKGNISFPGYLAKAIPVESGKVKFVYAPKSGTFDVADSVLEVAGSRVRLSGNLVPQRAPDGKLSAIGINLKSVNDGSAPVLVDNVEFHGRASVEEQRLDVDDFVVLQGDAGIRLRGIISGGELSAGLQLAGRLRDVNADLLKQLWPPILTPKTRAWVGEHVAAGRISEGTFQVNLPPDALADAQRKKQFTPGTIDLSFRMVDVTTRYFKGLAPMKQAFGFASLKDNAFDLTLEGANIVLPAGEAVTVQHGRFQANNLLSDPVTGVFSFNAKGTMQSLVGFASQSDLRILNLDLSQVPALDGSVSAEIGLSFPMIKDVPKELVSFDTKLVLEGISKPDVVKGVDLTGGHFEVGVTETDVTAQGTAKLNGADSKISWSKPRKGGAGTTVIETKLDKATQQRMGLALGDFMDGTVPLKLTTVGGLSGKASVEADLSAVAMKVGALSWGRTPTKGTSLTFDVAPTPDGGRQIENISLSGPGVQVKGEAVIDSRNTFRSANLSAVKLSDEYNFSARIKPGDGATNITIEGASFDARPYIKTALSTGPSAASFGTKANYVINASVGKVYANRGEVIQNVTATLATAGGKLRSAKMEGQFLNGQPISFSMSPFEGGREMKVTSLDGGSTLRAANFYSKVAGGRLEFAARIADLPGSPIRSGQLVLRQFEVRNEAALAELDKRGKPKKSGPRRDGILFKRLTLPFTTDERYFRLNDVELKGNDMGMVAKGTVRKGDGAICITGTMIPAQGINGGFIDDVPLVGQILTGGSGEGIFGITFALGGTISQPRYQVNPLSALAPGFLRKFFEFQLPKSKCGITPETGTIDSTY